MGGAKISRIGRGQNTEDARRAEGRDSTKPLRPSEIGAPWRRAELATTCPGHTRVARGEGQRKDGGEADPGWDRDPSDRVNT